jgi:DnaJ-class molecular chaperone
MVKGDSTQVAEVWERYSFYRILEVNPNTNVDDIKAAHEQIVAELDPDSVPEDDRKKTALERLAADAALAVLSDDESQKDFDARIEAIKKTASAKKKVETRRKGKLQEQQSIEEDEKLQKATERFDAAIGSLVEFYYDRLFAAAKESSFRTASADTLMEWLSSDRAESARASQQRTGRISFVIDWRGFTSVQEMRKTRVGEIENIVNELTSTFELP